MRTSLMRMLVPIALVATACGRGASDSSALTDDLRKDLEASSSAAPELAGAPRSAGMSVVSDIEQVKGSAPVERARAPRKVAARAASLEQDESESPAPEPANEVQVAEAPAETPQAPAPESDVPTVPSVAPRPAALPVDVPYQGTGGGGYGDGRIGTGRGDGRGAGIGDVIGIVIRGGGVGPDHCPPRRRGRPRFPILP